MQTIDKASKRRYQLLYRGVVADVTLTSGKAKIRAYDLAKTKGWEFKEIQIREVYL